MQLHRLGPTLLLAPLLALALSLSGCGGGDSAPADLRQAAATIKAMSAPRNLSRSAFSAAFPDGTPSQYVSFLFSTMGSAEMPVAMDEQEAAAMRAVGMPPIPATVALVARERDPRAGNQLVLGFDDGRGVVIARGYLAEGGEPVLEREWPLPKVAPAPGVEMLYRSNRELGMSAQAF